MMRPPQKLAICLILFVSGLSISSCNPSTSPDGNLSPPNILFAIADDASFPHMGAYGTDWIDTPAFDRVAREGLLFTRAYTPNAKCAPSRSMILTGRNSWQLEQAANHWPYFPEKFTTYAEAMTQHGYHVGYTAKGWAPGIALDAEGNRRMMTGQPYNEQKLVPPAQHISDNDYAANFEDFLDDRNDNTPFVFWYGSLEPHRAYEFGAGQRVANKEVAEIDRVPAFWPDTDSVRIDMLDYALEIEHFDQHLARMIALLEERGELDNTLIVVTADNGMPFPRVKGQAYEMSNHLPLAMMWPAGIEQRGRVVDEFVSFTDFAPTFLELSGMEGDGYGIQPMEGKSLTPIFAGEAGSHRDHVLIGKERHDIGRPEDAGYPMRGIVKGDYLYIRNFKTDRWPAGDPVTGYLNCDGSPTKTVCLDRRGTEAHEYWSMSFGKRLEEELYNIKEDPECMHNLAAVAEHADLKEAMKNQMVAELTAQQDPRILGNGDVFDNYRYADEKHAGFYERYQAGETFNAGWVNESDFDSR
ncbi:MAG: sulfatase, partial [Rhodothermales bacterium]